MDSYAFEDIVGDRKTFFSTFFNNRPLLHRGALRDRTDELISIRGMDDILAMEVVSPAYLRVAKDGKGVPSRAYLRAESSPGAPLSEVVDPNRVYELYRAGGTVTWNSLHHFVPSVRQLVDLFADTFGCRSEAVAFLTPARKDGYAPHHDPVDVFIIQIEGIKDWRVWDTPRVRSEGPATYQPEDLGPPSMETTLHPGDVLYLPYHTPHAAAAAAGASLHLSITVEPRRWRDLLRQTVAELTTDDVFGGFPALGESGDATTLQAFGVLLRALRERIDTVDTATELRRLAAAGRRAAHSGPREFERLSAVDTISATTRLRRSAAPLTFGASTDGKTELTVNGHRLAIPDAVARSLRDLDARQVITASAVFPGVDEDRSLRAAQGLARVGVLVATHDSRDEVLT